MAGKFSIATLVLVVVTAAALIDSTAAAVYVVGDSVSWTIPSGGASVYSNWASQHNFTTGDILVFNFLSGAHDLARVTKDAFDNCNSTSPISLQTVGPANFTLDSAAEYYFVCTFGQHCTLGQKLAINVSSTSGPTASPPASPPSSPSPAPSPSPSSTGTPSPAPPPASPSPQSSPSPAPSGATPPAGTTSPPPPPPTSTVSPPNSPPSPPSETTSPPPPPPSSSAPPKAVATFAIIFMTIAIGFCVSF